MTWSRKAYGPDGPWNAVEVSVGGPDKIALFPGRMWHTFLISSDYCALNTSVAHCDAGTVSTARDSVLKSKIQFKPPAQEYMAGIQVVGNGSRMFLDTLDLQGHAVSDAALGIIDSQMLAYPDGTHSPIFTGCLSVGAPEPIQTFGQETGPPLNSSIIPWALTRGGVTPSSSFGLHIGSAASGARIPGSLVFGGYDRNRVLGTVLSLSGDISKPALLKDIGITVIRGASPFSTPQSTLARGLLAANNETLSASPGLPITLDPCSPYITLPRSVCDNIASHLPVTYSSALGLYLWDTASPRYRLVVSSASALSFTFLGGSNTQNLTIHVPFRHLNLTLLPPLAPAPTPYFPCFTGGTGASVLGRAFFQDAFLGSNWETASVFLAQAPGPNIQPGTSAASIARQDRSIVSGGNDWETSWEGFWAQLTPAQANGTVEFQTPVGGGGGGAGGTDEGAGPVGGMTGGGEGMSTGVKIGLGVGIALGVVAVAGGVWIWKKRQTKDAAANKQEESETRLGEGNGGYDNSDVKKASWAKGGWTPVEMLGTSTKDAPKYVAEVDAAERGWRGSRFGRHNGSVYELGSA